MSKIPISVEYLNLVKLEQFSLYHSVLHSFLHKYFFCIPASAADAAAVDPNGIKTLLANGLVTFFITCNSVFNNGPRSLPKNPPD